MSLVSFEVFFPDIAAREAIVVCLTAGDRSVELVLVESYCADPDCQCERFRVEFVDAVTDEVLATVSHGARPITEHGSQRTFLDPAGQQAGVASHLLDLFRSQILTPVAEDGLKRHARMVRAAAARNPELSTKHRSGVYERISGHFLTAPRRTPAQSESTGPRARSGTVWSSTRAQREPPPTETTTLEYTSPVATLREFASPLVASAGTDATPEELRLCFRIAVTIWNALVDGRPPADVEFIRSLLPVLGRPTVIRAWKTLKRLKRDSFPDDTRRFDDFDIEVVDGVPCLTAARLQRGVGP